MKKLILVIAALYYITAGIYAQDNKDTIRIDEKIKTVIVDFKKGIEVDVYIDGKKYDSDILEFLDKDKIESIVILKGEEAMKKYNASKVLLITSKKDSDSIEWSLKRNNKTGETTFNNIKIRSSVGDKDGTESPVIIVDGEKKDSNYILSLNPDDISSVKVLKDTESMKEYNTKVGVIIISTKKKK